eukprot:GDKH01001794.1.p1 GENE.GDKH01001794.1~~GDKH01001794.1.p1  ORF type:complete len:197 (+),score=17.75 GDKH01001794.1:193-783(+)
MEVDFGPYLWKWRMARHFAYHTDTANLVIHALCIPLEIMGFIALLNSGSLVLLNWHIAEYLAIGLTCGLLLWLEPVCGALAASFLILSRHVLITWLSVASLPVRLAITVSLLLAPIQVQRRIGHGVFEPEGRDDTYLNVKEARESGSYFPLLLIFFYHLVDGALRLGYRPELRKEIAALTKKEHAALVNASFSTHR